MISHEAVVSIDRALRSSANQDGLLVIVTSLETERQRKNSKDTSSHIITEQQIEAIFTRHQKTVDCGEETPTWYELVRKTEGLHPYNPSRIRRATNWFVTDRPHVTIDTQGITRLPPMVDTGITTEALKRGRFSLASGVPVPEFVEQLIENVNRDFRMLSGQQVDALIRVDPPAGENGDYFRLYPFAYTYGTEIAWRILQPV